MYCCLNAGKKSVEDKSDIWEQFILINIRLSSYGDR